MRIFETKIQFYKNSRREVFKILFSVVLLVFVLIPSSSAFYADKEETVQNSFRTTRLDATLRSNTDAPEEINSVNSSLQIISKSIFIKNESDIDFKYTQTAVNSAGELCGLLNLEVYQKWYDTNGEVQELHKYSGSINSFWIIGNRKDVPEEYFPNEKYYKGEYWFNFQFTLLDDANIPDDVSCSFDINAKIWQDGYYFGEGYYDTEKISISFDSTDFPDSSGVQNVEEILENTNEEAEENL